MSNEAVTSTSLVTRMLADDRFASGEERCDFLAGLQARRRTLPVEQIQRAGCAALAASSR